MTCVGDGETSMLEFNTKDDMPYQSLRITSAKPRTGVVVVGLVCVPGREEMSVPRSIASRVPI